MEYCEGLWNGYVWVGSLCAADRIDHGSCQLEQKGVDR